MNVTEIVVSAGTTFNHPYEQYSNFRPQVTLKAALAEGDDYAECLANLQKQAHDIVEQRKQAILQDCKEKYKNEPPC